LPYSQFVDISIVALHCGCKSTKKINIARKIEKIVSDNEISVVDEMVFWGTIVKEDLK
jgi:hypothetical protein